jgi:hypothetical protein
MGADRRQFDAVVDHLRRLRRGAPRGSRCGGAVRAGLEPGVDDAVGVGLQHTGDAGAALARRLVAGRLIGLLAFRRRQRRVVGGLLRPLNRGQPRLQFGDPRQRHFQLPDQRQQRQDERILLRDGQLAEIDSGRHAQVESSRP